jgi:hypothetical protein
MYEMKNWKRPDNVNLRKGLETEALLKQKILGMGRAEGFWLSVLKKGQIIMSEEKPDIMIESGIHGPRTDGWILVVKNVLHKQYIKAMKDIGTRAKLLRDDEFGIQLLALVPLLENGLEVIGGKGRPKSLIDNTKRLKAGKRPRAYLIPPLKVSRELMDFRLNRNIDWEDQDGWEDSEDIF